MMSGPLFINGIGCISPQVSYNDSFLEEVKEYNTNALYCSEPDYSSFFDPASLRRMDRASKFATAAALMALRDSGLSAPQAISTGTGLGLLGNSIKFLKSVIGQKEGVVSPTPFIQSTHNTISGVVALLTGCKGHNNTFSQAGVSFECALADALMMLNETQLDNILVGAFDELSAEVLAVMSRLNILRKDAGSNTELFTKQVPGIIVGEGAAFFVLSKSKAAKCYGRIADHRIDFSISDTAKAAEAINTFLADNKLKADDVDIVISSLSGDDKRDTISKQINNSLFTSSTIAVYKHLCGEYMTASSFGLWLATKMLYTGQIPPATVLINRNRKAKNILLHNVEEGNQSLILLQPC